MFKHLKLAGWALGAMVAAATAGASPAFAQFDGFYFGGHGAYAMAHREGCTAANFGGPVPSGCDDDADFYGDILNEFAGPGGGAQAGFNVQNSNIVWGVEVSATLQNLVYAPDTWDGSITIGNLIAGTGRLGVVQNNFLFYVEGGVAAAPLTYDVNAAGCSFTQTLVGPLGGIGGEIAVADNFSIFAEVNQVWFSPNVNTCDTNFIDSISETQTSETLFKFGANLLIP